MDENISEMLKGVLSDPDAMSKIMGVAQGLMGNQSAPPPKPESKPVNDVPHDEEKPAAHERKTGNEERIALICALRPYLSPERRRNADSLIKMLKMMKLADLNKLLKG